METAPLGTSEPNAEAVANSAATGMVKVTSKVTINGRPAAGFRIWLGFIDNSAPSREVVSQNDGTVVFDDVPATSTDCFFDYDANMALPYESPIFNANQPPAIIPLQSGKQFSTRVTLNGQPAKNVYVAIREVEEIIHPGPWPYYVAVAETDGNGVATFACLPNDNTKYAFVVDPEPTVDTFGTYNGYFLNKAFTVNGVIPDIQLSMGYYIVANIINNTTAWTGYYDNLLGRLVRYDSSLPNGYQVIATQELTGPYVIFDGVSPGSGYGFEVFGYSGIDLVPYESIIAGTLFSVSGDTHAPDIIFTDGETVTTKVTLNGVPIPNVEVDIRNEHSKIRTERRTTMTDANGIVTFSGVTGSKDTYFLVSEKPGVYTAYCGNLNGNLFNVPSASYPVIALENKPTLAPSTLNITYKGKPAVDAYVDVYAQTLDGAHESSVFWGVTDENGTVVTRDIVAGYNYYVYISYGIMDEIDPRITREIIYYDGSHKLLNLDGKTHTIEIVDNDNDNGNGSSGNGSIISGGRSGGGSGGGGRSAKADTGMGLTTATTTTSKSSPLSSKESAKLVEAALKNIVAKKNTSIRVTNRSSVDLTVLKEAAAAAKKAGTQLIMSFDQVKDKKVTARISFDPAKSTKDIDLMIATDSTQANKVLEKMKKWYSNTMMVVSCQQKDGFGQEVTIAVPVSKELKTDELRFYVYNAATNSYTAAPISNHWIDNKGYIHFNITMSGDIIISDGQLVKK